MCTHVVVLLRVGEQLYACNSSIQTSAGVAAVATLVGGAAGGGGVVVLVAAAAAQAAKEVHSNCRRSYCRCRWLQQRM